jgi:hypothetical protein
MTRQEIADELDRLERELIETSAKCEVATREAMRIIEKMMADLGVPMAKERTDA